MTLNEWKARLTPAGVLFIFYLVVPFFVQLFMGANDTIYGSLTFSVLAQAGLGAAVVFKLFSLKEPLSAELTAWLGKFGQPQEKIRDLARKLSLAAGFIIIVAIVWPPLGEVITGRLMTLLKAAVLGCAAYLGYDIWKLAEPFLAYVPPPAPDPEEETAAEKEKARRCVKCGQVLPASGEVCTFCWHPIDKK